MSDAREWGPDDLPLVFRRDQPVGSLFLWLVLQIAGLAGGLVVLPSAFLMAALGEVPAPLDRLPFGPAAAGGGLGLLGLLLALGSTLHDLAARRRYGCCTVTREGLRFGHAGSTRRVKPRQWTAGLDQLEQRTVGRWGLLIALRGGPRPSWLHPLLVPTRDEAETARLIRLLDRLAAPAPSPP